MNTATAPNPALVRTHQPLQAALAKMREDLSAATPTSLRLFDLLEPKILAAVNNPHALTSSAWLQREWRLFFVCRMEDLFDQMEIHYRPWNQGRPIGLGAREGFAEMRELVGAFVFHYVEKHRAWLVEAREVLMRAK